MRNNVQSFRKAFPEMELSDVEIMSVCKKQRDSKRKLDNSIEKRVKHYSRTNQK